MDKETKELFNALLVEMDRRFDNFEKKFDVIDAKFEKLDKKIDWVYESLYHEINACKLDHDVLMMLVDKAEELEHNDEKLERNDKRLECRIQSLEQNDQRQDRILRALSVQSC